MMLITSILMKVLATGRQRRSGPKYKTDATPTS